ncbi:Lyso-phosphatidylcholine acyltransferase [Coemansia guatemalensis]|uniref:Lyso-phosphatidylcholine acyltransferase n=1 Tax=Coemansia guatemalensis TaxID=2761395 RepID=A0A9W8LT53_9FUNG|nr:Lyso-phosphatidylcholine acyltransferase [Coemansia guatemalensis]
MDSDSDDTHTVASQQYRRTKKLISQLPRSTWQERSYAFWVAQQLEANEPWWRPLSAMVLGATTTAMSMVLHLGFRRVLVEDLHKLTDVIESERSRAVVTVANHESTMDDPIIWGAMPARMRWRPDCTRWTLGAREMLYKNPAFNAFFALGQTIPTVRGDGIYQLTVEIGLRKLNQNKWVHVFPEGKINQGAQLLRFKWGVSRMLMEAERTPIVIPMFFSGMREVMPLHQRLPLPRLNPFERIFYIRVGDPIDFTEQVDQWRTARAKIKSLDDAARLDEQVRIRIASQLWDAMSALTKLGYIQKLDSVGSAIGPPLRYAIAVTAMASANVPGHISALTKHCNLALSKDELYRYTELSRESLLKMIATIGAPRVINGTAALMDVLDESVKKMLPTLCRRNREENNYETVHQRGMELWRGVYSKQADKLESKIHAWYPDLIEVIQIDLYGRLLSDTRVLDEKSTELCTIGSLIPINVPAQLKSHVLGAGRLGATDDEIAAATALAETVCAHANDMAHQSL